MYHKPQKNECPDFYQKYIAEVQDGGILEILANQKSEVLKLFSSLEEEQSLYRYADGKWSIKEVFGHLIDAERVFAYRAMCIARNDKNHLPPMDENSYVQNANFNARLLQSMQAEYDNQREATIAFLKSLDETILKRKGIANSVEFTVNAFPYIIGGHERHHLNVLHERYLVNL